MSASLRPRPHRAQALVVVLGGLAAVHASACNNTDDQTCDIPTDEISAVAIVIDSGWDLRATIDFERGDRRGNGAALALCETDRLTINGQDPIETGKASRVEYSISLETEGARSFTFALDRTDLAEQVTLQIDLPPAFEILSPADGDPLVLDQDLALEWEPPQPESAMRVRLGEQLGGGVCLTSSEGQGYKEPGGVQVPDTGQWTIPGRDLHSTSPEPCVVTITLARVELGDYPAALSAGGRVEARVERYIDLQATP